MSELKSVFGSDGEGFLPGLSLDLIIFGFHQNQLKVLLLEYHGANSFALPAGYIRVDEDLEAAAQRALTERTGLSGIYLEQYQVFGDCARHNPRPVQAVLQAKGVPATPTHWLLQRFVSVGFYALVDFTQAVPNPDALADGCAWHDFAHLPPLILDHERMVRKALETLQLNLDRKLIAFNLLPESFTMADLQHLYETVLEEKLNRTSFQRKMLGLEILERLDKKWTGGAHKAPYLYRFKQRN